MPDTNDFGMAGGDLATMIKAAETLQPMTPDAIVRRREIAEVGLKILQELVEACLHDDAQGAGKLVEEFVADNLRLRAAAVAWRDAQVVRQVRSALDTLGATARLRPFAKSLRKAINEAAVASAGEANQTLDALTGEPLDVWGLRCPQGFRIDDRAVWAESVTKEGEVREIKLVPAPLLVIGTSRDLEAGTVRLELAWKRMGRWHRQHVDRDLVLDRSKIVRLAKAGAPVTSETAKDVVRYLARFEDYNLDTLVEAGTSTHMGWTAGGFLLGELAIQTQPAPCKLELAAVEGPALLAKGFKTTGSWAGWLDVVVPVAQKWPRTALAIIASAAAPMLEVLGRDDGFVVDWFGETSRGKTTTLRMGASVWGEPSRLVGSWASSSQVGPMAVAWFLQSLPVILDDTKRGRRDVVASLMYDLPAGEARSQGTKEGSFREIRKWKTVLLSTGEAAITSFSRDAGARARCLVVHGAPFGDHDPDTGEQIRQLGAGLAKHHGHLGRYLIEYLMRADRTALQNQYAELRTEMASHARSSVEERLLSNAAVLRFTQRVIEDLGFPALDHDPIAPVIESAGLTLDEEDPATEAVRIAYTWAVMNSARFWGRHQVRKQTTEEPANDREFWGRWDRERWESVGFDPDRLFAHLESYGHDPYAIWATWQSRKWCDQNNGRYLRRRVNGTMVQLVALKAGVLVDILGKEITEAGD